MASEEHDARVIARLTDASGEYVIRDGIETSQDLDLRIVMTVDDLCEFCGEGFGDEMRHARKVSGELTKSYHVRCWPDITTEPPSHSGASLGETFDPDDPAFHVPRRREAAGREVPTRFQQRTGYRGTCI